MTLADIMSDVIDLIDDESYQDDPVLIKRLINANMNRVAGTVLLPELETSGTVTTSASQNYAALPTDFQRRLFRCYSSTYGRPVQIYGSVEVLFSEVSRIDQTGHIWGVARGGSNLYYQWLGVESLTVHYFKKPTALSSASDATVLPDGYDEILVYGTARDLFSRIEQGVEGQKVNTLYYDQLFKERLFDLYTFLGPTPELVDIKDDLLPVWEA